MEMDNSTSSATQFYNYQDSSSLLAAIVMAVNGVFGVTCNLLIVYIFLKETKERSAFNSICVTRAAVNIYILLTNHLGLFIPVTLTGKQMYNNVLETWVICIAESLYMANEYLTVVTAINRFISLFFPLYYSKLCGRKPTIFLMIILYAYRIGTVTIDTIQYTSLGCSVLYYTSLLSWTPDFSSDCDSSDGILVFMTINFTTVSVFNVATFVKIFHFYKNQKATDLESRKRIKKNAYLFLQTILQDSLYVIDILFTFYFFNFYNHRLWTFLCGTFVWESLHSFDGFIMIMFNERLSFLKKQLFSPMVTKVSVVRQPVTTVRSTS